MSQPVAHVPPHLARTDRITEAFYMAITSGVAIAPSNDCVVELAGPGAVTCIHGLHTNDIEGSGLHGVRYGATLTPKGRIVSDMWISRVEAGIRLAVPPSGLGPLLDVFRKFFPPRLATVRDLSKEYSVLAVLGPYATGMLADLHVGLPEPGTCHMTHWNDLEFLISRPENDGYFAAHIQAPTEQVSALYSAFEKTGTVIANEETLDLARIVHGWPKHGVEIDDRTLPQEVRFDELDGISYTKGCYTGQETVARLHFRGHVNRSLQGLHWDQPPNTDTSAIMQEGRLLGHVTSIAYLDDEERWVGLGIVHRKADDSDVLVACDAPAQIAPIPLIPVDASDTAG